MDERKQHDSGRGSAGHAWSGAHNRPGDPDEEVHSDVPEGEPDASRAEARDAIEHTPDTPSGHRGDLGDSGPGED
jgi:hypothetical protein